MHDHFLQFQREKTALKYFLIGRDYYDALRSLGFAERYHVGLRKDGKTPELHHQVQIALSISQLKDVMFEEQCLMAALLHDTQEDYQVPSEDIELDFGKQLRERVWKLTKKFAGTVKNKKEYIEAIALDPVASIVKGVDRNNNLDSMIGVFSIDKMKEYADEAENLFLPMLKKASKLFPEQHAAYHAISQQMKQLIRFTNQYVASERNCDTAVQNYQGAEHNYLKAENELKQVYEIVESEPTLGGLKRRMEELQEVKCFDRHNIEAFRKALATLLLTLQYVGKSPRDQVIGIRDLADKMRVDFGVSELDLKEFTSS